MSKTTIIMLAWFSPILICVIAIPPALVVWFLQKVGPILWWSLAFVVVWCWRRYPRWWHQLPGLTTRSDG